MKQRALWQQPADIDVAMTALNDAARSDYFKLDAVLSRINDTLREALSQ